MLLNPRYGSASLADVVPSILAHLGVPGEVDRIGLDLDGVRRVCVLLVDGLGAEQLSAHPTEAPFLNSHSSPAITAGFPTTTATSLSSFGTGLPPGSHGIMGYLVATPGHKRLMNSLQWKLVGAGKSEGLPVDLVPETFQPTPTAFERGLEAGVRVAHIGPSMQNGSGLTRAALRGPSFHPSVSIGDLGAQVGDIFDSVGPTLVYAYYGDLDLVGHVRGPQSLAWRLELGHVDDLAQAIAERLPDDGALIVVADHGMVEVEDRIDYDTSVELQRGIRLVGGEPRMRYLYPRKGAGDDVAATWHEHLGAGFRVLSRDEAIDLGWFGPTVSTDAYGRIGDLLVLANDRSVVIRSRTEVSASALRGHHGSLTSAELMIPALVIRGKS